MASGNYVRRIGFEVTEELQTRIQNYIPWGTMRPLLTTMIENLIDFIDEAGFENRVFIIGAILSGKLSIVDIMKKNEKEGK